MYKFYTGIFIGLFIGILLATASLSLAVQPIKLIVDGHEIVCDPPPQMIGGRVFVPIRFITEALGVSINWNENTRTVTIITTNNLSSSQPVIPFGFYPARIIIEALSRKYPNLKPASSNLNILPNKGEYRFLVEKGELWIDGKQYFLPSIVVSRRLYFSIIPLVTEGILSTSDIELLK